MDSATKDRFYTYLTSENDLSMTAKLKIRQNLYFGNLESEKRRKLLDKMMNEKHQNDLQHDEKIDESVIIKSIKFIYEHIFCCLFICLFGAIFVGMIFYAPDFVDMMAIPLFDF